MDISEISKHADNASNKTRSMDMSATADTWEIYKSAKNRHTQNKPVYIDTSNRKWICLQACRRRLQ
jgi:hypothetical protein